MRYNKLISNMLENRRTYMTPSGSILYVKEIKGRDKIGNYTVVTMDAIIIRTWGEVICVQYHEVAVNLLKEVKPTVEHEAAFMAKMLENI